MLYREMPKTGDKLSILGLGCMRFKGSNMNPNEKDAIALIRHAIDQGVNYMDTAWPYHGGKSEVILGKALKNGYREKAFVADKLPHWLCKNREDMDYYLKEQLKRLDLPQIDYYLIHALDGKSWKIAMDNGVIDFMNYAKKSRKVKHVGFSFHGARDEFKSIIDGYDWDFCQIQFNILDENNQAGKEGLEYAFSKGIGVVVMEPLRGGSLAGKQPADVEKIYTTSQIKRSTVEWSLRWIWNHPGVITVLSGMNETDQIDENIKIASEAEAGSLTEQELATVSSAAETFRSLMKVPCTGCQYCMPCPKKVNIPSSFSFYNDKFLFKTGFMSRAMYLLQLGLGEKEHNALASQCVSCGICVEHCPQKIDIPGELKNVKKEFEGLFTGLMKFMLKSAMSQGRRKK